jgi:hypothetical protein
MTRDRAIAGAYERPKAGRGDDFAKGLSKNVADIGQV